MCYSWKNQKIGWASGSTKLIQLNSTTNPPIYMYLSKKCEKTRGITKIQYSNFEQSDMLQEAEVRNDLTIFLSFR